MAIYDDLLACPRCGASPIVTVDTNYTCKACKNTYPQLGGIPFLFPEPMFSMGEWRERLHRLVLQFEHDAETLYEELKQAKLLPATKKRINILAEAYLDQVKRLRHILTPLELQALETTFETAMALRTQLPQSQGLTTYYANMHKDWNWGDEENKVSVEQVLKALGQHKPGKTLVLGAGACRLAYDVHNQIAPDITLALDINPLLLLAAKQITQGEDLALYEFPIAPKTISDNAVLRQLHAPKPVNENFYFVLADALHPPFAKESFDTIITPWLLDIMPEDLRIFAARVNRLLKPGGKWINFGSLSFANESLTNCYSLEEVSAICTETGFDQFTSDELEIPYMQSPASRHGRIEQVVTFSTIKQKNTSRPKRYESLPDWIAKATVPVPNLPSFQSQTMATRIHAYMMGLIDGKRSIKDMAIVLEQQRLMPRDEGEFALQSFLTKMYEDNLRNRNF